MMNNWKIRLASANDASSILDIYRPIVEDTAISFELICPTREDIAMRILSSFERHLWLVCTCDDVVTGYAYASEFRKRKAYRWITEVSVYVDEKFHHQGVAKALYDVLHAILKKQGYTQAMAVMTAPNPASQAFHQRYGYKHEALLHNMGYKFDQWHDIEIMSLELNETIQGQNEIIPLAQLSQELTKLLLESVIENIRK